jgi:antitoxin PrlF
MAKQDKNIFGCCKVEGVTSIDERGQMVLPKEIREKAGIKAGDKLAIVTGENKGKIYYIALIKAEELEETVTNILGSLGKQISK